MRWISRQWVRRPIAAVIAVWFVLVMVEPVGIHSCPVHGGHASAPGGAMHGAGASAHADHESAPEPAPHAGCTCPGDCTAGVGTPVPSAVVAIRDVPTSRAIVDAPALVSHTPSRAPFVLPFANGPPISPRPA
jgi:hypothetical protein